MSEARGLENSGRTNSLAQSVEDFMEAVDLLEDGSHFRNLNLLGGDLSEENRANFDENKAKRQLATESLAKAMGNLFIAEGVMDATHQQSFMDSAKKYLQLKGLKDLNEIYLLARGGDKLMTTNKMVALFSKLQTDFSLKLGKENKTSADATVTQQAVKAGVGKTMRGVGLELDAATLQQLGLQQASNPEHFARRVGTQTAFPMHGNKGRGGGLDKAA